MTTTKQKRRWVKPEEVYIHPNNKDLGVGIYRNTHFTFDVHRNDGFEYGKPPVEYYPRRKITIEQFQKFMMQLKEYAKISKQQHQQAIESAKKAKAERLISRLQRCKNSTSPFDNSWLGSGLSGATLREFLRQTNRGYCNQPATELAEYVPAELQQLYKFKLTL